MLFWRKEKYLPCINFSNNISCHDDYFNYSIFWKQIDLQLSFEAFVIILIIGIWFTYKSVVLFKKLDDESARKLMLASFLYLLIMQVIYIIDKYI